MTTRTRARALAAPLAVALLVGGALIVSAPAAGAVEVGDEASFRDAWANATEITLTADITLTCVAGGQAERLIDDPVTLDGAGHTIALEDGCVDRVLRQAGNGATTLRNVTITGGNTTGDGGGYEHDGAGSLEIHTATFVDNTACSEGGGVEVESNVPILITDSTFNGNRSEDESAFNADEGGDITIVNSTFTANVTTGNGAIGVERDDEEPSSLALVYVTLVGNIETGDAICIQPGSAEAEAEDEAEDVTPLDAGEPANLRVDDTYTFRSLATVIAEPIGTGSPTPNCDIDEGVVVESLGSNFSDDATCGFTDVAAGDRENAGSPELSALASNGGPTQTMLPAATSPLVDGVPLDACGNGDAIAGFAVTTDQRGVTRPQGAGCDIGAVELEVVAPPPAPPLVLEPRFTG